MLQLMNTMVDLMVGPLFLNIFCVGFYSRRYRSTKSPFHFIFDCDKIFIQNTIEIDVDDKGAMV